MLQAITWASPPDLRMPCATSSHASCFREEITTFAPSFARSSAEERPMPRLEPVITATCPVRSKGVDFMGCFLRFKSLRRHRPARPGDPVCRGGSRNGEVSGILDAPPSRGMTRRALHQSAFGDPAQVIIGVAERVLDHGQALEVVADLGLHGHADAAMELDRLLADILAGLADLHLGRGDRG